MAAASEPGSVAVADLVPPLAEAATPWPNRFCGAPDGDSATCVAGNPAAATTVALFGDSHATAWFPAMARLADERDWRLLNITEGSCLSIEVNHLDTNLRQYCANWRPRAIARIVRERPQIVVMTNRSWYNLVKPGGEEPLYPPDDGYAEVWKAGLASAIAEIRPYVGSIVILGDTPRLGFVGPDCIAQHSDYATRCTTPRSTAITEDILDGERAVAEATGSIFIDPTDWFCSKDTCPAVIGRVHRVPRYCTPDHSVCREPGGTARSRLALARALAARTDRRRPSTRWIARRCPVGRVYAGGSGCCSPTAAGPPTIS